MGACKYVSELWMKKLSDVIRFLQRVNELWRKKQSDVMRFLPRVRCWEYLQTAFSTKKDFGKEEREARWAHAQRILHGLQPPETTEKISYRELSEIVEQAKRRAEVARLRELHTLKGHIESVMKLKGLDIEPIMQHYSV